MKQLVQSASLRPSTLPSCSVRFQGDAGLPEVTIYPSDKLRYSFVGEQKRPQDVLHDCGVKLMYFANTRTLWVKEDNHSIIRVVLRDGTTTGLLLQAALLQIDSSVQSIPNTKPALAGGNYVTCLKRSFKQFCHKTNQKQTEKIFRPHST